VGVMEPASDNCYDSSPLTLNSIWDNWRRQASSSTQPRTPVRG